MIKTNKDLADAVNQAIAESGVKKSYIADSLGMNKQVFSRMLTKKSFSLDDANKILSIIGYSAQTTVDKNS